MGNIDNINKNMLEVRQMNWISVEEKLPEIIHNMSHSEDILAFCVSNGEPSEFGHPNTYDKDETYMCIDRLVKWSYRSEASFRTDRYYGKVTHWMPLPNSPEVKDG